MPVPQGQLIFDLSRGVDRFQARFDLASGQCSLIRITNEREQELDSKPTAITRAGKHRIRFANVDERLLVWVDNALPFGEGVNYPAPNVRGPTLDDLKPARIGVKSGGVTVSGIKLWRDTYYTANVEPARQPIPPRRAGGDGAVLSTADQRAGAWRRSEARRQADGRDCAALGRRGRETRAERC